MGCQQNRFAALAELLSMEQFRHVYRDYIQQTKVSSVDRPAHLTAGAPAIHLQNMQAFYDYVYNFFFVENDLVHNSVAERRGLGSYDPGSAQWRNGAHFKEELAMVRTAFETVNSNHHRSGKHTSGSVATSEMRQELDAESDDENQELTAREL